MSEAIDRLADPRLLRRLAIYARTYRLSDGTATDQQVEDARLLEEIANTIQALPKIGDRVRVYDHRLPLHGATGTVTGSGYADGGLFIRVDLDGAEYPFHFRPHQLQPASDPFPPYQPEEP